MRRALISVYDKTGILELAKFLVADGYEIISTSGTAKLLKENNPRLSRAQIKTVEELTKSPEILGGRVKTLHPFIFAGLLADRTNDSHINEMKRNQLEPIDLLVVNLYPFKETIKKETCTTEEAIEQIDIGGVSLIRAAAKNFKNVSVLVSPEQYQDFMKSELNDGYRLKLASHAFGYIAEYDMEISNYFKNLSGEKRGLFPIHYTDKRELRYGENPHQKSELFDVGENPFNKIFTQLHGKELSYINILDIDAAYNLINEFDEPTCAILKHTNPCGVASSTSVKDDYIKAFATDTVSPFGGIVIFNRPLDLETVTEVDKIFTEIIIAPDFEKDALEFLRKKKNRRLIKYNFALHSNTKNQEIKSVTGGILIQDTDNIVVNESEMKVVTNIKPTKEQLEDMFFAMKVCKHTKSNAVVYAKDKVTLGIGGGQPSRVDSSMLAIEKAKRFSHDLNGSSVASDAFFPFADSVIEAAKAGAKCIIQPGGSIRDNEVIETANEHKLAMVFTGIRHFKH